MNGAKRLVRKLYGWLGFQLVRVPGVHRSRWLWVLGLWLLIQPWPKSKQRVFLWALRLPDDLRTEFLEGDKERAGRWLDAIADELEEFAEAPSARVDDDALDRQPIG